MLERFDLLGRAVLEHLEVVGREAFDDAAVLRGIDVDADEVRADADGLLLRARREDARAEREDGDDDGAHD